MMYGRFDPAAFDLGNDPITYTSAQPWQLERPGLSLKIDEPGAEVHWEPALLCITLGDLRAPLPGKAQAVAALYKRDGERFANTLQGRYAAIVFDQQRKRVLLACDRFAIENLCFAEADGHLHFAQRADVLADQLQAGIDAQAIFDYLYFHNIPAPRTVFEKVQRVAAASYVRFDSEGLRTGRYWTANFEEHERRPLKDLQQEFVAIVESSVRIEAEDHRVGCFLSGGTDSSTIAGMLTRVLGEPADTFSIGFDAAGYDEMDYARIAAKHFGTRHHEHYLTREELQHNIPLVAAHYDQPFGNSSAGAAYQCVLLAKEAGIEKLLAGDGGDELFGGNTRYAKQRVFEAYGILPRALRRGMLEPALRLPGFSQLPLLRKAASYVEQANVPMPDRMNMYNLLARLGIADVLEPEFLAHVDVEAPARQQRAVYQASTADALVNRMLAFDWKYTLADNDLPKVVGTTQMAGLAVGFPLLADALLDFSLKIDPEWKLKGLKLRYFFKEALRGFLPDAIITKKKHGFGLPFGVWAIEHPGLRALAFDSLASLRSRGIVRSDFIDALRDRLLPEHPGYYGEMLWILMMMEQWFSARERKAGAATIRL
jgi:asparagine synthase (glutamine-hydrolysing)